MADTYRTFIGFVKFDLNDAEAAGKPVRSFVLRNVGVKEQAMDIRCTLWPSHEDVELEKGDAVLVEGKFSVNKTKGEDPKTYFNLSVSNITPLGAGNRGERVETANTSDDNDEVAKDDIPY